MIRTVLSTTKNFKIYIKYLITELQVSRLKNQLTQSIIEFMETDYIIDFCRKTFEELEP